MYAFMRSIGSRAIVLEQLPVMATSFVIAELFYKFHSFTLESLAFLATWYVMDATRAWVGRHIERDRGRE
jgi:hypothetical protein